jgi:hypothetical protein
MLRLPCNALRLLFAGLLVVGTLPFASTAQTTATPTRPDPTPPTATDASTLTAGHPQEEEVTHRFWDRTNILLFSGVGVMRGLDYASTRNMQARGREEILLPDDVVNNSAGFAALEAAGTAASIGISYWLHRTRHHTLERWISIAHISVAGFGDVRNYCLKTKH